jgi:hypothetical protein
MYIFELIAKMLIKKRQPHPQIEFEDEIDESDPNCEHFFMPVDSSNTVFACKYCGLVVPKEQLKNKNIFKQKTSLNFFRKK